MKQLRTVAWMCSLLAVPGLVWAQAEDHSQHKAGSAGVALGHKVFPRRQSRHGSPDRHDACARQTEHGFPNMQGEVSDG